MNKHSFAVWIILHPCSLLLISLNINNRQKQPLVCKKQVWICVSFNNLSKPSISLYVYMQLSGTYHEDFQVHANNYCTIDAWCVHQLFLQLHLLVICVCPIKDACPFFQRSCITLVLTYIFCKWLKHVIMTSVTLVQTDLPVGGIRRDETNRAEKTLQVSCDSVYSEVDFMLVNVICTNDVVCTIRAVLVFHRKCPNWN